MAETGNPAAAKGKDQTTKVEVALEDDDLFEEFSNVGESQRLCYLLPPQHLVTQCADLLQAVAACCCDLTTCVCVCVCAAAAV